MACPLTIQEKIRTKKFGKFPWGHTAFLGKVEGTGTSKKKKVAFTASVNIKLRTPSSGVFRLLGPLQIETHREFIMLLEKNHHPFTSL